MHRIVEELEGLHSQLLFGPFPDQAAAEQWIVTALTWGGWRKV